VLQVGGVVSPSFRWTDPARLDAPREVLEKEGVRFVGSHADEGDHLSPEELATLG
jgi:hypothetical protein